MRHRFWKNPVTRCPGRVDTVEKGFWGRSLSNIDSRLNAIAQSRFKNPFVRIRLFQILIPQLHFGDFFNSIDQTRSFALCRLNVRFCRKRTRGGDYPLGADALPRDLRQRYLRAKRRMISLNIGSVTFSAACEAESHFTTRSCFSGHCLFWRLT